MGLLLVASGPAAAESVTLAEAADRMVAYTKQIQMLELERNAATERTRVAYGQRLPRVQLGLSYLQTQQDIISQDNDTFQEGTSEYPTTTYGLSVIQPLYDAERFRQYPLATAEEQVAILTQEAGVNRLWGDLIQRFLVAAETQAQRDRQVLMERARETLWQDAQSLQAAGRFEAAQVLAIQSDYLSAQSQTLIANQQHAQSLDTLRQLVGPSVTGVDVALFADQLPSVASLERVLSKEQLVALNPAIQLADAELVVAERQLRLVNAAYYPKITLRVETEQETTEGSLFGGGSEVASTEYGVDVTWLLYEGGTVRARSREAKVRVSMAAERLHEVVQSTERRYEALMDMLRGQEQVLDALGREKRLAEERLAAVKAQVSSGRAGLGVVQDAELRANTLEVQQRQQALAFLKVQAELYGLFGALNVDQLTAALEGGALVNQTPSSNLR